ncbi:hypothetical protein EEB14_33335 [Rhodococcus sp. WS4]|nr:hypothetical protein EEB14_33335 [Rhodococcus sp. WS4]
MTDILVDARAADNALGKAQGELGHTRDRMAGEAPRNNDPRVAEALRALSKDTSGEADQSAKDADKGRDAARGLNQTDKDNASRIAATESKPAAANSGAMAAPALSPSQIDAANQAQQRTAVAQQQVIAQRQQAMTAAAQQQQQQQAAATAAAQQAMVGQAALTAQAASTVASTSAAYPPGTIMVDQDQLQQLIDAYASGDMTGMGGSGSGSLTPWNGSTGPEPIDVSQVEYNKTHGHLSREETAAVIDSSMDKTGITNPEARAKWKDVLSFMAEKESYRNASAVNLTDSNAVDPTQVDGAPQKASRGLWQTIPTTFAAHHAAGTSNNIYDPEASAGAAIIYIMDRYDVGVDGSGLESFYAARQSGGYTGY